MSLLKTDDPYIATETSRCAILQVSPHFLVSIGAGHFEVITDLLPPDVLIASFFADSSYFCVILVSAAFDIVGRGERIPVLPPINIQRLTQTDALECNRNSVLVLRGPGADERSIKSLRHQLNNQLGENAPALIIGCPSVFQDVKMLDREQMRQHGWVRSEEAAE